jgi:hypothetical protein
MSYVFIYLYFAVVSSQSTLGRTIATSTLVLSELSIRLLSRPFIVSLDRFFRLARLGEVDAFVSKPTGLVRTMVLRWCRPLRLVLALVPLGAVLAISRGQGPASRPDFGAAGSWLAAILCGATASVALFVLLNLPSLVVAREVPSDFLFEEISQLRLLPLPVYGANGAVAAALAVPSIAAAAIGTGTLGGDVGLSMLCLVAGTVISCAISVGLMRRVWTATDRLGG